MYLFSFIEAQLNFHTTNMVTIRSWINSNVAPNVYAVLFISYNECIHTSILSSKFSDDANFMLLILSCSRALILVIKSDLVAFVFVFSYHWLVPFVFVVLLQPLQSQVVNQLLSRFGKVVQTLLLNKSKK